MIFKNLSFFIISFFFSITVFAGTAITYHGRIAHANSKPIEAASVTFKIQILSPNPGKCLLYEETRSISMTGSDGIFVINVGDGIGLRTASDPGIVLEKIFVNNPQAPINRATYPRLLCNSGVNYIPQPLDQRQIIVSFDDHSGSGVQTLAAADIHFFPFAVNAYDSLTVGGVAAENLLRVQGGTISAMTPTHFTELLALLNGSSAQYNKSGQLNGINLPIMTNGQALGWNAGAWASTPIVNVEVDPSAKAFAKNNPPTCVVGQGVFSDGVGLSCVPVSGGGLGTVTSIAAGTGLKTNIAAGAPITASGTIAVDVGIGANQIVQMGSDAKLPALDGSKLTQLDPTHLSTMVALAQGGTGQSSAISSFNALSPMTTQGDLTVTNGTTAARLPVGIDGQILQADSTQIYGIKWSTGAAGSVTSVTAAGTAGNPLSVGGTASAPKLDIQAASASTNGYLTSTDWTTFNGKLNSNAELTGLGGLAATGLIQRTGTGTYSTLGLNSPLSVVSTQLALSLGAGLTTASGNLVADFSATATAGKAVQSNDPRLLSSTAAINTSGNIMTTGLLTAGVLNTTNITSDLLAIRSPAAGGNTIALQGPSTAIASSYTLRWPLALPASGTNRILASDDAGNMSWVVNGGGGGTVTSISSSNTDVTVSGTTVTQLTLNSGTTGGATDANKIAKLDGSGLLANTMMPNLDTAKINSGTLPISRGGTNSMAALNGHRVIASSASAMGEAAGITANKALISDANGIPTHSSVTGTELGYLNGVTSSLQTQLSAKSSTAGYSNYGVLVSNTSGNLTSNTGTTSGALLRWTASGPEWSTAAFPTSTTANQILYSSANNVVGGLPTANNAVLTTDSSGVPTWVVPSSGTDIYTQYAKVAGRASGQTLRGSTAVAENLTLDSTAHSTKGNIIINPTGGKVGIGASSSASTLEVNGPVSATNVNAAPIFSTKTLATRFSTTSTSWVYSGEYITITVPTGPSRYYRLGLRQLISGTAVGNYVAGALSTSNTSWTGSPIGMGTNYTHINTSGSFYSLYTEGYVLLAPGTYTYYVMVTAGGGTLTTANSTADDTEFCGVIAWPM